MVSFLEILDSCNRTLTKNPNTGTNLGENEAFFPPKAPFKGIQYTAPNFRYLMYSGDIETLLFPILGSTISSRQTLLWNPHIIKKNLTLKLQDFPWRRSPICGFLRSSAKIFGFLRKSAVSCALQMLEFPGEGMNLRKSAVFCENLRFGRSLSP